jgi:hypothetical protein
MAFGFNPFTGNFDLTGGGDAAPFAGQVDAYADLPLGTTAALNSRWLVKNNSGTWPFSTYKQGGIYIRVNTVGASRDTDYQFVGTLPSVMNDSEFLVYDDTDATKNLKFQLSGITTGTTRTLTAPDASGRIQLEGQAIGDTTPAAGTFTTLRINSTSTLEAGIGRPNLGVMGFNRQDNPTQYNAAIGFDGTLRGFIVNSAALIGFSNGNPTSVSGADTRLWRDAANTLALQNTTNAQTFNIYNTHSSSTNHERLRLAWASNVAIIGTEKGSGGGTARALEFQTDGVTRFSISDAGAVRVIGALRVGPNFNSGSLVVQHGDGVEAFRCQYNATFDFGGRLFQMGAGGTGGTIQIHTDGDNLMALRRGTNAQNLRIYNTVSGTNNVNFERTNFRWASNEFILDAEAGGTGTLRGIKIGSATSSLLGFFGATPVVQQAAVADATDAASTQAGLNDLLARLRTLGLIAT